MAWSERVMRASREARDQQQYLSQKVASAGLINQFLIRTLIAKRRTRLYYNIIRSRVAFTTFARHARIAAMNMAMPVCTEFIQKHAFHREVPSLGGALSRFRSKVIRLQKWWIKLRTIRGAYAEFFIPLWMTHQTLHYKVEAEKQAHKEHLQAMQEKENSSSSRGGRRGSGNGLGRAKPGLNQGQGTSAERRRRDSRDMTEAERKKSIEASQDQLPDYVAKVVLLEYVMSMQRSFRKRMKEWKDEVEKDEFKHDLEGFGIVDDMPEGAEAHHVKPRLVYVDMEELQALVDSSIKRWARGFWKEIRHNRFRLLRRTFKWWQRWPTVKKQMHLKSQLAAEQPQQA